jgi:hypothetical protein
VAADAEADPTSAASTIPGMLFLKPEMALISTIDGAGRWKPHPQIYRASCGILEGIYLFSITYTKAQ